jgi:hypothetical protein
MNGTESQVMRILITSSVVSKIADYGLTLIVPLAVLATTGSNPEPATNRSNDNVNTARKL